LTTKLIQALASALHRAVPRLKQFGMCQRQIASPQNLGLLIFGEFVVRTFVTN
jgi:hypothetical protein